MNLEDVVMRCGIQTYMYAYGRSEMPAEGEMQERD